MRAGAEVDLPGLLRRRRAGAGSPTSSSGSRTARYEVVDTKLARHAKPAHVLQLCFYTEQVARIQGRDARADARRARLRRARDASASPTSLAYYRRVRERFLAAVDAGARRPTRTRSRTARSATSSTLCEARWDARRPPRPRRQHPPRPDRASSRRRASRRSTGSRDAPDDDRPPRMAAGDLRGRSATRPSSSSTTAAPASTSTSCSRPSRARGFALLPQPSPGDLFFDIEGDPFWEPSGGLEYLFGVAGTRTASRASAPSGRTTAHEREARVRGLHRLRRRAARAPSRPARLPLRALRADRAQAADGRSTARARTRSTTCSAARCFVDLFTVVRQGVRISHPSYSLKKVEAFYIERATPTLQAGGDSIVALRAVARDARRALLDGIEAYNEEDCVSTLLLRDWLLELRPRHETRRVAPGAAGGGARPPERSPPRARPMRQAARLLGAPTIARARLMAQLLDYHRREAKPVWWAFFDRQVARRHELVEDAERSAGSSPPASRMREASSLVYTLAFPAAAAQALGRRRGRRPGDGREAGTPRRSTTRAGRSELKRGQKRRGRSRCRAR